jgi:hypothetical protein
MSNRANAIAAGGLGKRVTPTCPICYAIGTRIQASAGSSSRLSCLPTRIGSTVATIGATLTPPA